MSVHLDEDSDVVYQFDAVVREDSLAEVCLELVMRCAACVDDFYPQLMKAVWS